MSTDPYPDMGKPLPLPKISINGSDAGSKDVPEDLHRQQSLDTAYQAAFSKTELSKTQKKVERVSEWLIVHVGSCANVFF